MKRDNFKNGMAMILQCFPNKDISLDVAWELLSDIEDKRFLIAIKDICSTTTEMYPNTNIIALIREIALSGAYLLSGEAWEEVIEQIRKTGYAGKPEFKDQLTAKAVEAIGWQTLCNSDKIAVDRAHFLRIYESYIGRAKEQNVKLPEVKQLIEQTTKQIESDIKEHRHDGVHYNESKKGL